MKNPTKQQTQANLLYAIYISVSNFGSLPEDQTHFSLENEFTDPNPLIARQKAFESIKGVVKALMILTDYGFLNVASPTQAKQRDWKNYTKYSYTITLKVTDDNGNLLYEDPINNGSSQEEAILGLIDEYSFYKRYGYDTGETMELEDGDIVLLTDTSEIYDR